MGVAPASADDTEVADAYSRSLGVPLLARPPAQKDTPPGRLFLLIDKNIPSLCLTEKGAPGPVPVGFEDASLASRRHAGHNELLGRAVGWKLSRKPQVLDTTAGFARDAFVMADLGCIVTCCERQPLLAELLATAFARARTSLDPWLCEVSQRLLLHRGDARTLPLSSIQGVESIYLDPMFSVDRKAKPGKEMQILQRLIALDPDGREAGQAALDEKSDGVEEADDNEGLLQWALRQPVHRVVVKRSRRAPPLGGLTPGHTLNGKSVRFDVYPCAAAGS